MAKSLIISALLVVTYLNYDGILFDIYSNTGLVRPDFGLEYVLVAFSWAAAAAFFIPRRIERPSDFFLLFYNVICVLWGAIFWPITGLIAYEQVPLFLALLVLPNIVFVSLRARLGGGVDRYIPPVQLASWRANIVPFSLIALVGALLAYSVLGSGSFSIDGVYDRRLDARASLLASPLTSYALNMATNGAVPILAFIAGYRKSLVAGVIAVAYVALVYWLVGQKSPILNVAIMVGIGWALRDRLVGTKIVPFLLLIGVLGYTVSLVVDFALGNTLIADVVVRRISVIQPQIQAYYFDLWSNSGWRQILFGVDNAGYSDLSYRVGATYFGSATDNANVNAFTYALTGGGLVGYLLAVLTVTAVFSVIDSFYRKTSRVEFFGVAAMFAILLSEQAYTTSLLSSGIALCLVLVMLFSYP